jgi:hypothetical protein
VRCAACRQAASKQSPLPRLTERPDRAALDQTAKGQEVTQLPVIDPQAARSRHSVLQSPSGKNASRRRLLGVLAGSGVLAALVAATVLWLWPATPETAPPPTVDPTVVPLETVAAPPELPVVVAPEPPPVVEPGSEPAAVVSPLVAEPVSEPPVIAAPPVAATGSEPPGALTLPPAPVQDSATGQPAEPALVVTPAAVENVPVISAPLIPVPTPKLQKESDGSSAKIVADKPSPRARNRTDRKRRQPVTRSSSPPVQAPSAPAPPTRPSYWDKPTDSGFNNK